MKIELLSTSTSSRLYINFLSARLTTPWGFGIIAIEIELFGLSIIKVSASETDSYLIFIPSSSATIFSSSIKYSCSWNSGPIMTTSGGSNARNENVIIIKTVKEKNNIFSIRNLKLDK